MNAFAGEQRDIRFINVHPKTKRRFFLAREMIPKNFAVIACEELPRQQVAEVSKF